MLFLNDNEEFFAAGPANAAAGNTWQYVGTQPVPEGHVAIPSVNPDTGKEIPTETPDDIWELVQQYAKKNNK